MKRRWAAGLLLAGLCFGRTASAADGIGLGDGHWGSGSDPISFGHPMNGYAALAADASGKSVTVVDATTLSVSATAGSHALAAGDLLMFWQWGGYTGTATGAIDLRASRVGAYELARVASIAGNTITLDRTLSATYPKNASQVVLVPEWVDLSISSDGGVTATPFDPTTGTGGIVAFLANGTLGVGGLINASGAGFPGGKATATSNLDCSMASTTIANAGAVGGGIWMTVGASAVGGFGALGNGGGGGGCNVASAGGGSNGSSGGFGGRAPLSADAGAPSGGGLGAAALTFSSLDHLLMGGGGGGGGGTTSNIGDGAAGGGVVWIRAVTLTHADVYGTIAADGSSSSFNSADGPGFGMGGGGAGGTISIRLTTSGDSPFCNSASTSIHANGGSGGTAGGFPAVWGGDGGAGRVLVQASGGCTPVAPAAPTAQTLEPTTALGGASPGLDPNPSTVVCPIGSDRYYCAPISMLASHCNPSTGECGACASDQDCTTAAASLCSPLGQCTTCVAESDCSRFAATPHCKATGAGAGCVACRTSSDCGGATPICNGSNVCVACSSNTDCATANPSMPVCDTKAGSATLGQCKGCLASSDCTSALAPVCGTSGACGACINDADCAAFTGQPRCAKNAGGACVQCLSSSDCTSVDTPLCVSNVCVSASSGDAGDAGVSSETGGDGAITKAVTHCSLASDCGGGFCVEGVCCDRLCDGLCESCTLAGSPGVCTKAPRGIDPKGQCGTPADCLKTCGGDGTCVAAFEGAQCAAPHCTGEHTGVGQALCMGAGVPCSTAAATQFDCGSYICDPAFGACRTNCTQSSDCATGYFCDATSNQCSAYSNDVSSCSAPMTRGRATGSGLFAAMFVGAGLLRARRARRTARRS